MCSFQSDLVGRSRVLRQRFGLPDTKRTILLGDMSGAKHPPSLLPLNRNVFGVGQSETVAWSSSFLIRMRAGGVAVAVVPFESSVYALPKMREGFMSISFIRFPIVFDKLLCFFIREFQGSLIIRDFSL